MNGGGAFYATLRDCRLSANSASMMGGGACDSALYSCTLTENSASRGGGAYEATLYNCTLAGNSAESGGGVSEAALYNCIVYYNTASDQANYDMDSSLRYCCATPDPGGTGNITSEPQFVNYSAGDCIFRRIRRASTRERIRTG